MISDVTFVGPVLIGPDAEPFTRVYPGMRVASGATAIVGFDDDPRFVEITLDRGGKQIWQQLVPLTYVVSVVAKPVQNEKAAVKKGK